MKKASPEKKKSKLVQELEQAAKSREEEMNRNRQRQFAINSAYGGLRNTGYSPEISGAMLESIGVDADCIRQAATAFGDA